MSHRRWRGPRAFRRSYKSRRCADISRLFFAEAETSGDDVLLSMIAPFPVAAFA
jgi:hypothetical protein